MSTPPDFAAVSHVQLRVRDLAASEDWYTRVLGFARFVAGESGGRGYVAMRHRPSRFTLVLSEADPEGPTPPFRPGIDHLALAIPREDVAAWVDHLAVCGVHLDGPHEVPEGASLLLADPDGMQVELLAPPAPGVPSA